MQSINIGVPGNSMPSNKFCVYVKPLSAVDPYTLPDNTKINLMTIQDHIFMVFDSLGRPASTKKLDDVASISIVRNPNKGNFKLSIDKGQFNQVFITIYSGSGQVILNNTMRRNNDGEYNISLPKETKPGLYFITAKTDTGMVYREKILVDSTE